MDAGLALLLLVVGVFLLGECLQLAQLGAELAILPENTRATVEEEKNGRVSKVQQCNVVAGAPLVR